MSHTEWVHSSLGVTEMALQCCSCTFQQGWQVALGVEQQPSNVMHEANKWCPITAWEFVDAPLCTQEAVGCGGQ